MNIGIIGVGVVGSACKFGFDLVGHQVATHDILFNTTIDVVIHSEIIFVCVPTPMSDDGETDISIVRSVVSELANLSYSGIVAIKSTVPPGSTELLRIESGLDLCFVPEFLRERCANEDFTENHDVCIIGTDNVESYKKIKQCHGKLPDKFVQVSVEEAEFCKFFNNVYNATLVVFANSFFEACKGRGRGLHEDQRSNYQPEAYF